MILTRALQAMNTDVGTMARRLFGVRIAGRSPMVAVVITVAAVIGLAALYEQNSIKRSRDLDALSVAVRQAGPANEAIANLENYARSIEPQVAHENATPDKMLPDVETMIDRLAARLETTPGDAKGWSTLGWSQFQLGRFERAVAALEKAVALNPTSSDLRIALAEAKASVAEAEGRQAAAADEGRQAGHTGRDGQSATQSDRNQGDAIRALVDSLAARLERLPDDVDGWTHLIRSRVALGEKQVATSAYLKALAHFENDSVATDKITALAIELALSPN